MTQPTQIPDKQAYREQWARLDRPSRKRIMRAVNRAKAVEDPHEAALAVSVARGQQRFWRWAWLGGPLIIGVAQVGQPLPSVLLNIATAVVLFGLMAVFFTWRSRKAERGNLAVVEQAQARRNKRKSKRASVGSSGGKGNQGRGGKRRKRKP